MILQHICFVNIIENILCSNFTHVCSKEHYNCIISAYHKLVDMQSSTVSNACLFNILYHKQYKILYHYINLLKQHMIVYSPELTGLCISNIPSIHSIIRVHHEKFIYLKKSNTINY